MHEDTKGAWDGVKTGLWLDLALHFTFACILAALFYLFTKDPAWVILAFIGGTLIDLDHLLDYFLHYGMRFNLAEFLAQKHLGSGKVYLFLHSWELIALLWLVSIKANILVPLVAGMTVHLMTDHFLYSGWLGMGFYSLAYRWRNGFNWKKFSGNS